MPAFKNNKTLRILVAASLLIVAGTCLAEFEIQEVEAVHKNSIVELKGSIAMGLSAKSEEALSKGIPLNVIIEVRLNRTRKLLWDQQIQSWAVKRQIHYHALSRQYLVTTTFDENKKIENFTSLQEALNYMGQLEGVFLSLEASLEDEFEYKIELRAFLDIQALPSPLIPVAYTSPDWQHNSGWTTCQLTK